MADFSPMMQQYFKLKKENPGTILFFRLGDFYEMFFDDATLASKELELTLTGRDCGQDERAPMCGVPYHSCEGYIARLVAKGYKVSICEQLEDPASAKGIVKRDIVRVITPGTVTDTSMLDEASNNYLASLCVVEKTAGICFVDSSTGKLYLTTVEGGDVSGKIIGELGSFLPKEIILNRAAYDMKHIISFAKDRMEALCNLEDDMHFDAGLAKQTVEKHFSKSLEELKIAEGSPALCALGAALYYLFNTQKTGLENINKIEVYEKSQHMQLDLSTVRNLEIFETIRTKNKRGSLLWALDNTKTAMGKRMLRSWLEHPLVNPVSINYRLDAVAELFDNLPLCTDLSEALSNIHDLERLITRIVYGSANPPELLSLAYTLRKLPGIKKMIAECKSAAMRDIFNGIDELDDVCSLIERAIAIDASILVREGGIIKKGYNETLDSLRGDVNGSKGIIAEIEAQERQRTGIKNLKIGYNKVFGYYIEITNSYKEMTPEHYIRKQTLSNCERYITQQLKEIESRLLGAHDRAVTLEYELFCEVRGIAAKEFLRIQTTADSVARLDTLSSLATAAVRGGYACPAITTDGKIIINDGRHPVVEKLTAMPFVPNDTILDTEENRCCIITGPNMAGKSTYMRQIALMAIMAQIGSFVPAKTARISIVDAVFTRIGASDDLSSGQSTFMVEMNEVANILNNATKHSLILLDEIGRGTSTYDGMAIARAVLEYVASKQKLGAKTLFATHYHELTAMEDQLEGVTNYNVVVKKRGDDITFLHRIVRGSADRSYGIEVAKLAGINNSVVARAKSILKALESENTGGNGRQAQEINCAPDDSLAQISFTDSAMAGAAEKIRRLDVNSLTPIEALNALYELAEMLK